ncbi:MAG: L,D-transpeptidase [Gammaproteobacteria bacterium]
MSNDELIIEVSIAEQRLRLRVAGSLAFDIAVSTAKNGPGEFAGSECTPCGWHIIRAKIGQGCATNTVFVGRRPTGEIYAPRLREDFPQRDWILTRILWLSGLELGKNRLGKVDTMRRYIYIHGCPDEDVMGEPSSHGCIKMRNSDVIELFNRVRVGTRVLLSA